MADIIRLKKGLDIPLAGKADPTVSETVIPTLIGIVPDDFPGFTWRLQVKPGETVSAGTPLLADKDSATICLVAPAGGTVKEVRRGERRKIEAVVVEVDSSFPESGKIEMDTSSAESVIAALCRSGLWAMMRQRPYDVIPAPGVTPRDIFITAFDSAPLAPRLVSASDRDMLEAGVRLLSVLTAGKVYLGVAFGSGLSVNGAEVVEFQGPHPAGNVGVQIANIKPVNKGEVVWALDARTVVKMGEFATRGFVGWNTEVAVTGPMLANPHMISTVAGCDLADILRHFSFVSGEEVRVISGNVLTGTRQNPADGFLRYPYRQVTVIREGAHADEFMGWASLSPKKFSVKHSFPAFLRGLGKPFDFDARVKGGRRAPIVSGEYDKVFPMDIYPEFLLRAIAAGDIDRMEKLGIYEVAPEDFALPEFVDTSKIELQRMVREGLDNLRKEME